MWWKSGKSRPQDDEYEAPARPSALSLVLHILRSLVSNGMQWLFIPALLLVMYLNYNHIGNEVLTTVIFGGLAVLAVLRGCKAWQNDLNDYQRHLSLMRHREDLDNRDKIPGYFPSRRY